MIKKILKFLPILLTIIMCACVLTACVDADFEVQQKKMTDKGYFCYELNDVPTAEKAFMFAKSMDANKLREVVFIYYYKSDADAAERERRYLGYEVTTLSEEIAKTYTYVRVGKIFIHGTEVGVRDALS